MPTAVATEPRIEAVRSHSVAIGWNHGRLVTTKEELFPRMIATWRGTEYAVELEVSRYSSSDAQWSPWRIFIHRAHELEADALEYLNGRRVATDTARRAMREACEPLATEWLGTEAYSASRRVAYARQIRQEIRDKNYDADTRPQQALENFRNELGRVDFENLSRALELTDQLIATLELIPQIGQDA